MTRMQTDVLASRATKLLVRFHVACAAPRLGEHQGPSIPAVDLSGVDNHHLLSLLTSCVLVTNVLASSSQTKNPAVLMLESIQPPVVKGNILHLA